jgi:phospholipid transport system substrate-binding protein
MMLLLRCVPRLPALLLAALVLTLAPTAQAATSPSGFIETLGTEAISLAANMDKSASDKSKEFRQLLRRGFALDTISRFVLGRYWRRISDEQKERYRHLFEDYLVATYTSRFHEYSGETFKVVDAKPSGEHGTLVTTRVFRPQGAEVVVGWQVVPDNDDYRIVDVIIEGISMSVTQRSDFASAIQANGGSIDAFLDSLEQKVQGQR